MTDTEKLKEIREYLNSRVIKPFKRKTANEVYADMRFSTLDDIADEISASTDIIADLINLLEVENDTNESAE